MTPDTPVAVAIAPETEAQVRITRIIDAPRDAVFQALTDPLRLAQWYAPRGCTFHFSSVDLREGGAFHSCIRTPDGHDCWCIGVYLEINTPERLVFTMAVADEHGNAILPADAGMDPAWPAESRVTVTFADLDGKTRLTLHQSVSEALAMRTGAYPSWLQMLDRLAEALAPQV